MPARKYTQEILLEAAIAWMEHNQAPLSSRAWDSPGEAGPPSFAKSAIHKHFGSFDVFWEKLVSRGKMTDEEVRTLKRQRYKNVGKANRRPGRQDGLRKAIESGVISTCPFSLDALIDF